MAGATRRAVIAGSIALAARPAWASVGGPAYLSSARDRAGGHVLVGLTEDGRETFRTPLPARGHAAAARPTAAEAVVFARRPGRFALVIDCANGAKARRLTPPEGRHFYGHGVFSRDGGRLFTTENAYESGEGRIGVWDALDGYRRIGEFPSCGIGPHDALLNRDGDALIVANGGIRTHPDTGRAKLNLPDMRPNLAWLDITSGELRHRADIADERRMNSLRHLALAADGAVAVGAQWQGAVSETPSLIATLREGETLRWISGEPALWAGLKGYIGSVAVSREGQIAATGPRAGRVVLADASKVRAVKRLPDASGVAGRPRGGFAITSGAGWFVSEMAQTPEISMRSADLQFDNHLVAIGATCGGAGVG